MPRTRIYKKSEELPAIAESNFFHSRKLFDLYEQTPGMKPYMVVAYADSCTDEPERDNKDSSPIVIGHMLAVVGYRHTLIPPFIYKYCLILGEGCYPQASTSTPESQTPQRTKVFSQMLDKLLKEISTWVGFIEFSNIGSKMFGYKEFREKGFFPVRWLSIRNSLHSRLPEERISEKMKQKIERAYKRGITTEEISSPGDIDAFYRLLKQHNILKLKRHIPDKKFFETLSAPTARLFATRYNEKTVGCAACIYSEGNAYLWYFASKRKSYARLHPDIVTIWHVIKDAHARGFDHFIFLDVGLPFRKSPLRDFILRFGGKSVSTLRWFRFGNSLLNKIFFKLFS